MIELVMAAVIETRYRRYSESLKNDKGRWNESMHRMIKSACNEWLGKPFSIRVQELSRILSCELISHLFKGTRCVC